MKKQLGLFVNGENKGAAYYNVDANGLITLAGHDMPIVNSAALERHGISKDAAVAAINNGTWRSDLPAESLCKVGINDHIEFVIYEEWLARDKAQYAAAQTAREDALNIPEAARKAKARYGSAERAWEAEDEQACFLIQKYYDAPYEKSTDPVTKEDF